MGFRFLKTDRLLKRSEFVLLSQSGKKIHSRHFLALYKPGRLGTSRLGITVTRKVANAVGRNRIKRLVRESFRHHRQGIRGCWDINLVAKQGAGQMTATAAWDELQSIFEKLIPDR